MKTQTLPQLSLAEIKNAQKNLEGIDKNTPLEKNRSYSKDFEAQIFLKREDQQRVRSYKIRGAYHKIISLTAEERAKGVVCASAGNHAQGVAYSCKKLNIDAKIFSISPDAIQSQQGSYYEIELELFEQKFTAGNIEYILVPGIQVQIFILTGERTVLSYITTPFHNGMGQALQER